MNTKNIMQSKRFTQGSAHSVIPFVLILQEATLINLWWKEKLVVAFKEVGMEINWEGSWGNLGVDGSVLCLDRDLSYTGELI